MMELFAALSGAGVVVGRMLNAQAGGRVGLGRSTFNNYWVGLVCCLAAMLLAGGGLVFPREAAGPFMYLGGALGVGVVMISSLVSLKIPTLRMTLLVFISQMAAALLLDAWMSGAFSLPRAAGCALVLAGFGVSSLGGDAPFVPGEEI
jgi:transporter family-2 protein